MNIMLKSADHIKPLLNICNDIIAFPLHFSSAVGQTDMSPYLGQPSKVVVLGKHLQLKLSALRNF